MALDITGLALVILFFIRGYMKGLIVAVFSFLAVILGVICSLKLSERLASYLAENHIIQSGWVQIISYLALFIGVFLIVRFIAKAIESTLKASMLGWLNGLLGGLIYAFMVAVIWSSFLWLCNEMQIIKPETIAASKTYPFFSKLAPWVCDKAGLVWPMAKHLFSDLRNLFNNLDHKTATHVGTAR